MSCQASLAALPSRSILRRSRLSQAATTARPDAETVDSSIHKELLERLEAIHLAVQQAPNLDQLVRVPEALQLLGGISKSTWYARLNPRSPSYDPRAPKPFKLGMSEHSPSVWWRSALIAYAYACANPQATFEGGAA